MQVHSKAFLLSSAAAAALLLSAGALASAGAHAHSEDAPSRRVSFADLDITRQPGVLTLYSRIRTAAAEVCRPAMQRALTSTYGCTEGAITRAVADVGSPLLTRYYLDHDRVYAGP